MFVDPDVDMRPAPFTHSPFNAIVAPRPIGWITTMGADGDINLAPFSYFNAVSSEPPFVIFAPNAKPSGRFKDSYRNVTEVPEFVVNLASWELRDRIVRTSKPYPYGTDEMQKVGLTPAASIRVRPPRVAEARAALECTVYRVLELPEDKAQRKTHVVVGRVVGIFVDDSLIVDGRINPGKARYMSRLGYSDYACIDDVLSIPRPD